MSLSKLRTNAIPTTIEEGEYLLAMAVHGAALDLSDYLSGELNYTAVYHATAERTREFAILTSWLAVISTICARNVTVQIEEGAKEQCPAIYVLCVAKPGSGKSQSIDKHCLKVLNDISTSRDLGLMHAFTATFAAYREWLRDTNGFGSVIGDEILGVLTGILNAQDNAGSTLNKVWAGEGVMLRYKSATSLNIRRSSSLIYGMIHPTDLCDVLKSWQTGTGFLDRWLIVAVNDLTTDYNEGSHARKKWRKPKVNMPTFFSKLYDYFNGEDSSEDFKFIFGPEAQTLIGDLSKDLKSMKQLHNAKLETEGISAGSSPFLSKIEDNTQKLALLLHILITGFDSYLTLRSITVPLEIAASTVRKAIAFIKKSADTAKIFKSGLTDLANRPVFTFELTPGKFLTSRIYNESHTGRKGFERITETEFLSRSIELSEIGYGTVIQKLQVKPGGKKINVFYKRPPQTIEKNLLFKKGIIPTEYDSAFNANFKSAPSKTADIVADLAAHSPYKPAEQKSKRLFQEIDIYSDEEPETEPHPIKRKSFVPSNINFYLSTSESESDMSSSDSES